MIENQYLRGLENNQFQIRWEFHGEVIIKMKKLL